MGNDSCIRNGPNPPFNKSIDKGFFTSPGGTIMNGVNDLIESTTSLNQKDPARTTNGFNNFSSIDASRDESLTTYQKQSSYNGPPPR